MKAYTEPKIKVFEFDVEEILTASTPATPAPTMKVEEDGGSDEPMEWSIIHQ